MPVIDITLYFYYFAIHHFYIFCRKLNCIFMRINLLQTNFKYSSFQTLHYNIFVINYNLTTIITYPSYI